MGTPWSHSKKAENALFAELRQ